MTDTFISAKMHNIFKDNINIRKITLCLKLTFGFSFLLCFARCLVFVLSFCLLVFHNWYRSIGSNCNKFHHCPIVFHQLHTHTTTAKLYNTRIISNLYFCLPSAVQFMVIAHFAHEQYSHNCKIVTLILNNQANKIPGICNYVGTHT